MHFKAVLLLLLGIMWKGLLVVANPQRTITWLCSSRQLYGAFWGFFGSSFYCFGSLLAVFNENALTLPAHWRTIVGPRDYLVNLVGHLAKETDIFLRCWWKSKQKEHKEATICSEFFHHISFKKWCPCCVYSLFYYPQGAEKINKCSFRKIFYTW